MSLPAVQWLIASGEPTWLVIRSPRQEGVAQLIPGLAGSIREIDLITESMACAPGIRYVNLRAHPLQTDHVWGSPEFDAKYPGFKIADIVREISHDFGLMADFENLHPLPFSHHDGSAGKVILVPGSGGVFKCWPGNYWLKLAEQLTALQIPIVMLGQPEESAAVAELLELGLPWLPTPTLKDALDAVSSAHAMVSVDTGLLHLALQQGIPAVGMWINNPGSLNYLRTVRHCFPIVSPRCAPQCVSEELDKELNLVTEWREWHHYDSWTCHADERDRCMNNVTVDSVMSQFQSALSFRAHSIPGAVPAKGNLS